MPKDLLSRLLEIPLQERAVLALEKIADALDRALPPGQRAPIEPPSGNLIDTDTDEEAWKNEQIELQKAMSTTDSEEMVTPPSSPPKGSAE